MLYVDPLPWGSCGVVTKIRAPGESRVRVPYAAREVRRKLNNSPVPAGGGDRVIHSPATKNPDITAVCRTSPKAPVLCGGSPRRRVAQVRLGRSPVKLRKGEKRLQMMRRGCRRG
jgi:hypothetical protein